MKKKLAVIVALVAITLFFPVWIGGQQAQAADINILPYYVAGNVGDYWTYSFISPTGIPDFTPTLTKVTSGQFTGKYLSGDWVDIIDSPHIRWNIIDWDAGGINLYATESTVFSPPVTIGAVQTLDKVVANAIPFDVTSLWYWQKLSSLTVLAGTFDDVLVHIDLAKGFGPTIANTEFGLDPAIPYGVTHVTWMAAGIGEIQNRDYDQYGNILFEYQLKATSVTKHSFNPAIPLLLLDGYVQ